MVKVTEDAAFRSFEKFSEVPSNIAHHFSMPLLLARYFHVGWTVDESKATVSAYVNLGRPRAEPISSVQAATDLSERLTEAQLAYTINAEKKKEAKKEFPFNDAGQKLIDKATMIVATNTPLWYRAGTILPKLMDVKAANEILDKMKSIRSRWEYEAHERFSADFTMLRQIPLSDDVVLFPENLYTIEFKLNTKNPLRIFTEYRVVKWSCDMTEARLSNNEKYTICIHSDYDGSEHRNSLRFSGPLPVDSQGEYFIFQYTTGYKQCFYLSERAARMAVDAVYHGHIDADIA